MIDYIDIDLKSKHLEGEALLVIRLGSRHLPVHQIDRDVLVDLIMFMIAVILIMIIDQSGS